MAVEVEMTRCLHDVGDPANRVQEEEPGRLVLITGVRSSSAAWWLLSGVLGEVEGPGGIDGDASPGGRIGQGQPGLGEPFEAAGGPILVRPLQGELEARRMPFDWEGTRPIIDEPVVDGNSLNGRRGGLGGRRCRQTGRESVTTNTTA